jgi:hypothetical protein
MMLIQLLPRTLPFWTEEEAKTAKNVGSRRTFSTWNFDHLVRRNSRHSSLLKRWQEVSLRVMYQTSKKVIDQKKSGALNPQRLI